MRAEGRRTKNGSNTLEHGVMMIYGTMDESETLIEVENAATVNHPTAQREELLREEESVAIEDQSGASASDNRPTIGTLQLAVIVFYNVAGGPFGTESAVRSAGALYTLLGFSIAPFIWCIPEALITSELGTAYPEAAGTVAWVQEAFGARWGWVAGCLTWVSGATDNAIYPALFLDYLLQIMVSPSLENQDVGSSWLRFTVLSSLCVVLSYFNFLGLPLVGDMSITICFLSMSPFIVFCLVGAFKVDPSRWLQTPLMNSSTTDDDNPSGGLFPIAAALGGGVLWRPFLNNLFWNLNSFDSAACIAGEVRDPGRSFPTAMFWGVILVVLGYLIPLLVALGATNARQEDWVDGYMGTIASDVVGPWLGFWVVFAAGISNLALFEAEMSSDAYQLMGMAERGYLPRFFAHRSRHGTPTYGILLGCFVILLLSVSDLDSLIEMLNFNYSLALLLEYAAFIKLRFSKPNVERPFRIPLNKFGCIAMLVPNFLLTLLVMGLATATTYIFSLMTICGAVAIYQLRQTNQDATQEEDVQNDE